MSERMTVVEAGGSGLQLYGTLDRDDAVAQCRRSWEHQLDQARRVLAALDDGEERVFHQRGVWVAHDRREVPRATPEPTDAG